MYRVFSHVAGGIVDEAAAADGCLRVVEQVYRPAVLRLAKQVMGRQMSAPPKKEGKRQN